MQCWNPDYTEEYTLLGSEGSGGEGTTYQVADHPELIAKIYSQESLDRRYPDVSGRYTWTMQEKIFYMTSVAHSLPLLIDESGSKVLSVAWPLTPLFDANNKFVGFLMPRLECTVPDMDGMPDLHFAYRPRERRYLFGQGYTWLTAIRLAKNLSTAVRNLHDQDIVIGDFNCNNILIDQDAHVMLIDADSFCVHNKLRGITYKCVVGVGEFIAPELQGVDLTTGHSRRTFTKESDCFSLAIHIFMLLMNGTHPFSGAKVGAQHQASSSAEPFVTEIATGACPYVTGSRLMPFSDTIRMSALPYEVRHAFDRTFGYASSDGKITEANIRQRPSAREWEQILEQLYRECAPSLGGCPVDSTHVNPPDNKTCMWCELDGKLTRLGGQAQAPAHQHNAGGTGAVPQGVPAGRAAQGIGAGRIPDATGTGARSGAAQQGVPGYRAPAPSQQLATGGTGQAPKARHKVPRALVVGGAVAAVALGAAGVFFGIGGMGGGAETRVPSDTSGTPTQPATQDVTPGAYGTYFNESGVPTDSAIMELTGAELLQGLADHGYTLRSATTSEGTGKYRDLDYENESHTAGLSIESIATSSSGDTLTEDEARQIGRGGDASPAAHYGIWFYAQTESPQEAFNSINSYEVKDAVASDDGKLYIALIQDSSQELAIVTTERLDKITSKELGRTFQVVIDTESWTKQVHYRDVQEFWTREIRDGLVPESIQNSGADGIVPQIQSVS